LTLFLLSLSIGVQGQQTLWFHELGKEDGLSTNIIVDVFVDSEGLTWIAAVEGLFRYDGYHLKQYASNSSDSTAISENFITSRFFEDEKKNIWFSTTTFIHCYIRKNDNFIRDKILNNNGLAIKEGYKLIYLERDSFLWLQAGDKKIFRYNIHNGIQSKLLGHLTFDIAAFPGVSPEGDLRFIFSVDGKKSAGLEVFEHDGFGNLSNKPIYFSGNDLGEDSLFISNVIFEQDTLIWLAANTGIYKWNFSENILSPRLTDNSSTTGIFPFSPNQFIVYEFGEGLSLFNKKNNVLFKLEAKSLKNPNSNLNEFLIEPYLDKFKNLWVINGSDGLVYTNLSKVKFESFPKMPLYNQSKKYDYRTFVQDDKNNIWCSTNRDGIFLLNDQGSVLRHYHPQNPVYNSLFDGLTNHVMLDTSQNLWVATVTGIAIYSPFNNKFIPVYDDYGKHIPYATYFYQLKSGDILVSTLQHGIYRAVFTNGQWSLVQVLRPNSDSDPYLSIYEDSLGTIYIAHKYIELLVFNYSNGDLKLQDNLPVSGFVNGFHEDKEKLWIATSNGLVQLDKAHLENKPVYYTEKDGLPSKNLKSIIGDLNGDLWLGSTKGITKLQMSDTSFYNFSLADGMQSQLFFDYAAVKLSDGSLWFGGNNGITIVKPKKIELLTLPPDIIITEIKINGELPKQQLKCELTGALNISEIQKLTFESKENSLSIKVAALEYSDPSSNQFKYHMKGENDDWINNGTDNTINLSFLSPGYYTLEVDATNSDGKWSENPHKLQFRIKPPWYLSIYAIIFYILATIGIIYAYYRYRIAQIRKEANYKQMIAETETAVLRLQMNPHFIFNSMNSISSYILQKDINTANDYLGRFARLMRMILDFAAKPLIEVADEVELLTLYLQTETMRFESRFDYTIDYGEGFDPDEFLIPPMILQPFVENSILHAFTGKKKKGKIAIRFWEEENSLFCSVEDNGIGRGAAGQQNNKAKTHESKALIITKRRMELLGQKGGIVPGIEFIDLVDDKNVAGGTRVLLRFPIL
jgi:two-component sensor histidine kinase